MLRKNETKKGETAAKEANVVSSQKTRHNSFSGKPASTMREKETNKPDFDIEEEVHAKYSWT